MIIPRLTLKNLIKTSKSKFKQFKLWFFQNARHQFLSMLFILLLLIPIATVLTAILSRPVEAAWFDIGYSFRKLIPIYNTSSAVQTDFQVQQTIDTATLITAGKMQSDCDDMRFTDIGGKVLSYWLEPNTCNTASTLVWVKVPSIAIATSPNSGADIFFYYGNTTAISGSDSTKTFIRDMTQSTVAWPLDDTVATQPYSRVVNPAIPIGTNTVLNSGFDSDTIWTKGNGWTIANGVAHSDGTGISANLSQAQPFVIGKSYSVTYTVSNYVSGSVRTFVGGVASGLLRNTNGTFTETIVCGTTPGNIFLQTSSAFVGDIDNVTVAEINVPASPNIAASEVLVDGNMEAAGTAAWTATSGAVSKQTTTPHGGSNVLRITRTGLSTISTTQSILTVNGIYRITGYVRSDGNSTPLINVGTTSFTGTTSTSWQPFDYVAKSNNGTFALGATTVGASQYVEYDDVSITLDTSLRQGELMQDGDMEVATTVNWIAGNSATITKQTGTPHGGSNVIRVAYNAVTNPNASQLILAVGKTYRVIAYGRSDGTALPRIVENAVVVATGTNSTSWQLLDATFVATGTTFRLQAGTSTAATYAEFDDVSLTEIPPLIGIPLNGVTLGSSSGAGGHLTNGYTFDGTNDVVNVYSSDFNSVFNQNEGTLVTWIKIATLGTWTDSTIRYIGSLSVGDGNNYVTWYKLGTGVISAVYNAGGTLKSVSSGVQTSTGWLQLIQTWSKKDDQFKFYINGAQIGSTQTGLGTWAGNLNSTATVIGAASNAGASPWSGMINDVRIYDRALTTSEITDQYSANSDIQAYTTGNFPGRELLRKYNTAVTLGAAGTEEVGPGPIGYWSFDEGQGQTINDQSAQKSNGTLGLNTSAGSDDPTWQTEDQCISSKCLKFDGVNNYVRIFPKKTIKATVAISFGAWVKWLSFSSDGQIHPVIMHSEDPSTDGFSLGHNTTAPYNKVKASIAINGSAVNLLSTQLLNIDQWYFIESVYDGSNVNLYINGQLDNSTPATGTISWTGTSANMGIGHTSLIGNYFNGFIDEPKVYAYGRSAAQVKVDFNLGAESLGKKNQSAFLSNGLVSYWKMDESAGNSCSGGVNDSCDSSGNAVDMAWDTAAPTITTGKFGNGLNFVNASSQFMSAADTTVTSLTSGFTISGWVKATTVAGNFPILAKDGSGATRSFYLAINNSKFRLLVSSDGTTVAFRDGNTTLSTGTWYFITAVFDPVTQNINIYLNGNLDNGTITGTIPSSIFDGNAAIRIGSDERLGQYYDGILDEFRIFNRTLNAIEVANLAKWAPGPVGYWKLDDGTGSTTADSSGNGNTGTLLASPTWTIGKTGKATSFTTANQAVQIPDNNKYDNLPQGTVSFWFKPSYTGAPASIVGLFSKDSVNASIAQYGAYHFSDGNIYMHLNNLSATLVTSWSPVANTWYHMTFIWNGTNILFYINGLLVASPANANGTGDNSSSFPLYIGAYTYNSSAAIQSSKGVIDEFKIYNYVRNPNQIIEDMNAQSESLAGGNVGVLPKPLAYWSFDEGSGTVANNIGSSRSVANGTLVNMASPATATSGWVNTGKVNKALAFDGSNDVVSFASAQAITPTTGSVSGWVNSNGSQPAVVYVFAGRQSAGTARVYIQMNALALSCSLSGGTGIGSINIPSGVWTHFACTWDGAVANFYVNGKIVGSNVAITPLTAPATTSYVGAFDTAGTSPFNGMIDELKTYSAALTAEQVKLDMNTGAALAIGTTSTEANLLAGGAGNPAIGYWPMDERVDNTCTGGSNDACDKSGNANDAAWNGTLGNQWKTGKLGAAGNFNGTDNYLMTASNNTAFDATSSPITVEAWIYPTSSTARYYLSKGGGGGGNGWAIGYSSSGIAVAFKNAGVNSVVSTSTTVPALNTWSHIAVVMTVDTATLGNNNIQIYINGVLSSGTPTRSSLPVISNSKLKFGARSNESDVSPADFFQGKIDDVKIFGYARTQAQVAYDYNRGGPLGWWQFDECQGLTAYDNSGNAFNGTITLGASPAAGTCNTGSTAWGNGSGGKYNSSLSFDGTDDGVNIYSANLNSSFNNSQGTITAWAKVSSSGVWTDGLNRHVAEFATDGNNGIYIRKTNVNNTLAALYKAGGVTKQVNYTITSPSTNWFHTTLTWDKIADQVKFYVNGQQIGATQTGLGTYVGNLSISSVKIGAVDAYVQTWAGQIDDVRLYNYALSQDQINQVYNNGAAVFYGPPSGSP